MKNWFKKTWNWLLGKTTVDEKVVEVVKEVKEDIKIIRERAKRVAEEAKDVQAAVKEVVKQSKDVVDAARGGQRKGRKSYPKKNTTNTANTPVKKGSGNRTAGKPQQPKSKSVKPAKQ